MGGGGEGGVSGFYVTVGGRNTLDACSDGKASLQLSCCSSEVGVPFSGYVHPLSCPSCHLPPTSPVLRQCTC